MLSIFVFLFGTAIGSFLSAFSYRLLNSESIVYGRSHCDHCREKISWYDNIPLISYILLLGKCRYCGKRIPFRYFITELLCGVLFLILYCASFSVSAGFQGSEYEKFYLLLGLPYLAIGTIVISVLVIIYITDLSEMIIPDFLVNILIAVNFFALILSPTSSNYYDHLLGGFVLALFLLILSLVTKGAGMGLGDVKLALALGFVLGLKSGIAWMSLSFIIGAIVGVFLIISGKAKFGMKVPFGPFLIISFFIIYFFGGNVVKILLPGI